MLQFSGAHNTYSKSVTCYLQERNLNFISGTLLTAIANNCWQWIGQEENSFKATSNCQELLAMERCRTMFQFAKEVSVH